MDGWMDEFFGFGEDLKHKHPPKPQTNQPGDQERNQPANLKGITKGFFKGIILVSLRVIDGGFCPGNQFSTIRRGLRHIRYIILSDRLLELGIGFRGRASIPRCRQESSPAPPPESILALV